MYTLSRTHTLRELLPHLCAARRMHSTAHVTCPSVCCSAVRSLIFVHGGDSLSCMLYTLVDSFWFFDSSVLIDIVTESLVKTTQYTSDQLFLGRQSTVPSSLTFPMASGQCDWIDAALTDPHGIDKLQDPVAGLLGRTARVMELGQTTTSSTTKGSRAPTRRTDVQFQ
jgi:hypothetical protein